MAALYAVCTATFIFWAFMQAPTQTTFIDVSKNASGETGIIPAASTTAVSYTHLDVYKRQMLFLLTDEAHYITGEELVVDGGFLIR